MRLWPIVLIAEHLCAAVGNERLADVGAETSRVASVTAMTKSAATAELQEPPRVSSAYLETCSGHDPAARARAKIERTTSVLASA